MFLLPRPFVNSAERFRGRRQSVSCVLRAHGESFQVKQFLADSPLKPDTVYERADPLGSQRKASGFSVTVSGADFSDLEGQIREATLFLDEYEEELRRLGGFPGVEGMSLDFGVMWRDGAVQTDVFPADLLWRAGALDIWIAITHYPAVEPGRRG
jgi:hypothetical protein